MPERIATLRDLIMPSDYRAFAGVFKRADKVLSTRIVYYAIGGRRYGDLRDWPAIAEWAGYIAAQLRAGEESAIGCRPTTDSPQGDGVLASGGFAQAGMHRPLA